MESSSASSMGNVGLSSNGAGNVAPVAKENDSETEGKKVAFMNSVWSAQPPQNVDASAVRA